MREHGDWEMLSNDYLRNEIDKYLVNFKTSNNKVEKFQAENLPVLRLAPFWISTSHLPSVRFQLRKINILTLLYKWKNCQTTLEAETHLNLPVYLSSICLSVSLQLATWVKGKCIKVFESNESTCFIH